MADEGGSFRLKTRTDNVRQVPDSRLFGPAIDVRPFLKCVSVTRQAVALVTLYKVCGAGPRRPGAQVAVTADNLSGFLSGGRLEADLIGHARNCLDDRRPRWLTYGETSPFSDIQLSSGRRIDLMVEYIAPDDQALLQLIDLTEDRHAALWLSDGRDRSCSPCGPCGAKDDAGETGEDSIWVRYNPLGSA